MYLTIGNSTTPPAWVRSVSTTTERLAGELLARIADYHRADAEYRAVETVRGPEACLRRRRLADLLMELRHAIAHVYRQMAEPAVPEHLGDDVADVDDAGRKRVA